MAIETNLSETEIDRRVAAHQRKVDVIESLMTDLAAGVLPDPVARLEAVMVLHSVSQRL